MTYKNKAKYDTVRPNEAAPIGEILSGYCAAIIRADLNLPAQQYKNELPAWQFLAMQRLGANAATAIAAAMARIKPKLYSLEQVMDRAKTAIAQAAVFGLRNGEPQAVVPFLGELQKKIENILSARVRMVRGTDSTAIIQIAKPAAV